MYLQDVIDGVNETHKGLGELVAVCQLVVTAHKMLLIVSPSGCGKSTAMKFVSNAYRDDTIRTVSTSRAGLGKLADELNNSEKLIVVEDLSTTQTPYARASTMTALTALTYDHNVSSNMGGEDGQYSIDNFYGSSLVGIQPKLLKELLIAPEWETTIRDKVLRYYHLYRPIEPDMKLPRFQLRHGDIKSVAEHIPDKQNILWHQLLQLAYTQFSRARATEHMIDYLRACACLDKRTEVGVEDYEFLLRLFRPIVFETIAMTKIELEGDLQLNSNLLLLLAEYFSYGGQFSLAQVAIDHQITLQQAYRIMNGEKEWEQVSKSPTIYKPTKSFVAILKKYKLET